MNPIKFDPKAAPVNFLLTGVGGQGTILASNVIAEVGIGAADAVQVIAYLNYITRVADGVGIPAGAAQEALGLWREELPN